MPVRQTQSYLRNLFAQRGISPKHRMGQNFLIDLNIHELIVEEAKVGPDDVILEVGPGAGALTAMMAGRGAMVVAVDVDPAMAKLTQQAVTGFPSVRVLDTDALANKNALSPIVIENARRGAGWCTVTSSQAGGELALQRGDARHHQPARPPRALSCPAWS